MKKLFALLIAICGITFSSSAGYIITSCGIAVATVMGEEDDEDESEAYMTPEEWKDYLKEVNEFYCGKDTSGKAIYVP